jgi:hypothetical protein
MQHPISCGKIWRQASILSRFKLHFSDVYKTPPPTVGAFLLQRWEPLTRRRTIEVPTTWAWRRKSNYLHKIRSLFWDQAKLMRRILHNQNASLFSCEIEKPKFPSSSGWVGSSEIGILNLVWNVVNNLMAICFLINNQGWNCPRSKNMLRFTSTCAHMSYKKTPQ